MSAPARDNAHFVRRFPDKCCAEVNRRGESQPCDLTAVAVAKSTEAYDPDWWPVCRRHLRGRELVPLQDLVEAVRVERAETRPPIAPRGSQTARRGI